MSMQSASFHKHIVKFQEIITSLDDESVADYTPEFSMVEFGWLFCLHCTVLSLLAARCGPVTIDPVKSFAP